MTQHEKRSFDWNIEKRKHRTMRKKNNERKTGALQKFANSKKWPFPQFNNLNTKNKQDAL